MSGAPASAPLEPCHTNFQLRLRAFAYKQPQITAIHLTLTGEGRSKLAQGI